MLNFKRALPAYALAACAGLALTGTAMGIDFPETEPNDNKAQANAVSLACLDSVSGTTTGSSTTVAGDASADGFLITSPTAAPGIYLYTLTLDSTTTGHSATIRGLTQSAGVPAAGSDTSLQFSTIVGASRINKFYGFGNGGQIHYRVTGTTATLDPYIAVLSCETVTPIAIPGTIDAGSITIRPDAATDSNADTDFWVYDSNFNAIPGYGHDDLDATGLTRNFTPGTYYIAFGNFNTANDQGSPADDTFRVGTVTDFPNVLVNTSTTSIATMNVELVGPNGTFTGFGSRPNAFEVQWFTFTVVQAVNPIGTGTATPSTVINDGTGSTTLQVVVSPGTTPDSTAHTVTADLSQIGGSFAQVFTEGPANVFTFVANIPNGSPPGNYMLPFTVQETAPLARSSSGTISITIGTPPMRACCISGFCSVLTEVDCLAQSGTFLSGTTTCSGCTCVGGGGAPANDECANAITVAIGSSTPGTTCNATLESGVPATCGTSITTAGVWYRVIGNGNQIEANTCSSSGSYDTKISIFCAVTGCGVHPCISGNDDACGLLTRTAWCSQNGAPYYILVHGFGGQTGQFQLDIVDLGGCTSTVIPCIATGACCQAGNVCDVRSEADCATAGGSWLGTNTTCSTTAISYSNTYSSAPGLAIPDSVGGIPGEVTDSIFVSDVFAYTDVSVLVNINHTWIGDLIITLEKGSTSVIVWTRQCGSNDNMRVTFSDAGVAVICATPTIGEYLPANPLSAFPLGETSNGTWTLRVSDNAGADLGTLLDWSILFNRSTLVTNNCAQGGACCQGSTCVTSTQAACTGPNTSYAGDGTTCNVFGVNNTTPCCLADYNQVGGVTVQDIFDFLGGYFTQNPYANINGGSVGVQDIFDFLAAYFGGCN